MFNQARTQAQICSLHEIARGMHIQGLKSEAEYYYLEALVAVDAVIPIEDAVLKAMPTFESCHELNEDSVHEVSKAILNQEPFIRLDQIRRIPMDASILECPEVFFLTVAHNLALLYIEHGIDSTKTEEDSILPCLKIVKRSILIIEMFKHRVVASFDTMTLVVSILEIFAKALCHCEQKTENSGVILRKAGIEIDEDWFEVHLATIDIGLEYVSNPRIISGLLWRAGQICLVMGMDDDADNAFFHSAEMYDKWENDQLLKEFTTSIPTCAKAA